MINAGYEFGSPVGQPVTAAQLWYRKVQPGETIRRMVAFDLPADIRQPGQVFTKGISLLSVVIFGVENGFFQAKTEFLLKS